MTTPTPPDVAAHLRRTEEVVRDADRVRRLTANVSLDSIPKQRELVLEGGQTQEVIIAADALDVALSHPDSVANAHDLLGSERMTVYRYDGEVPVVLSLADDVALIVPYDEQRAPRALVESADEAVREWVRATLDDSRSRAERVTRADLPT